MLELIGVSKVYESNAGSKVVLKDINLRLQPGDRHGILGLNGSGKSTLVRILGGAEEPSSGIIHRGMTVSWPLGFSGAFQNSMSGVDNIKFIARLYGQNIAETVEYCEYFTELGKDLREPVQTYSSGMRAKLAFGVSLAIKFDCYLIDELTAVGDDRFKEKCDRELLLKQDDTAIVLISHMPSKIKKYCTSASVLAGGNLTKFPTTAAAYKTYKKLLV